LPSSVKRLCGYSEKIGSLFRTGFRPVRMAGTFPSVSQSAVVALRYHVELAASDAKLG